MRELQQSEVAEVSGGLFGLFGWGRSRYTYRSYGYARRSYYGYSRSYYGYGRRYC